MVPYGTARGVSSMPVPRREAGPHRAVRVGKPGIVVLRAALLSILMLSAIVIGGAGVYSAGAVGGQAPSDGYGITAMRH